MRCVNERLSTCKRYLRALSLLLWAGLAPTLSAQDQTILQMVHSYWTGKDGAPQAVSAFAQTPDGTLWIGSLGGLFAFDGLKFETFKSKPGSPSLSSRTIQLLLVSKAGDVWAFGFHGPPVRIHQGDTMLYDRTEGEPIETLDNAREDSGGVIWAVLNYKHVVRLGSDGIWHRGGEPIDEGPGYIRKLFIDSSGTQWVVENDHLYRRPDQQVTFMSTGIQVYGWVKIAESPDRSLWIAGQGPGPAGASSLQHVDSSGKTLPAPRILGEIDDLLMAADGSLWISKTHEGLERLSPRQLASQDRDSGEPLDWYRVSDGLSSGGQHTFLRDEDGNVWVGGTNGLDRFEYSTLVPVVSGAKAGAWFSCVDSQSRVWVGDQNGRISIVEDGRVREVYRAPADLSNLVCGKQGQVYVLDLVGLTVIQNGEIRRLPRLPKSGISSEHYMFLDLLELPGRDLLVAPGGGTEHGLWIFKAGKWSPYLPDLALPEVCGLLRDPEGVLYLAYTSENGNIGRVKANSLENLSAPVRSMGFVATSYGTMVYGADGIALNHEKSFQLFSFIHPEQAKMITGGVQSRNGDVWINGLRGIVRIPAAEIRAALADPSHLISTINFQEGDLVGPDIYLQGRQSAHSDAAGRLWFSMLNGVVSVDPEHLREPRHPPQLSIRGITADGQPLSPNATFPPGTQYLDVQYFGLDLTRPKNVVYRYRLDGLDTTWQDVGPRTEAIYTHLRPGQYTFQVVASSGNDLWTSPISSVRFRILPRFYQRASFATLCFLSAAALLWFAFVLRLRFATKAIRMRAEERADERIRIARELHDTLLQGVQGLLLSFHVAAQKVPVDHESRKALEKALSTADRIILEGRNRVNRLRSEHLTDRELQASIEGVASELNGNTPVEFVVERKGENNTLQAHIVDEIFCIAREALTNAFRHSEASRIVVELDYQRRQFRFTCSDNGRGFDAGVSPSNQSNGHWGLRGMQERSEKIGATFSCRTSVQKGTDVQVIVPARRAYVWTNGFRRFSSKRGST
jgi:signal transduction histidine kinase/ligand-binding sensor domain-containing protein